jgi:histidine decarboxylase
MKNTDSCLHDLFKFQAKQSLNQIAIMAEDRVMTYQELDQRTNCLAAFLQSKGLKPGDIVAIFMERSSDYIIAIIAILKAGGVCANIEISLPETTINTLLWNLKPHVVITKHDHTERLPRTSFVTAIVEMDSDDSLRSCTCSLQTVPIKKQDLALVWSSSGTTGIPKSVLISHQAVRAFCLERDHVIECKASTRYACNSYLPWEIFRSLLKGAPFYLISDSVINDAQKLLNFIDEHAINEVLITPSQLYALVNQLNSRLTQYDLSALQTLWIGGEPLTTKLRDNAFEALPADVRLLNMYGTTECSTIAINILEPGQHPDLEFCSVGFPHQETILYLLDKDMQPVPKGEVGEIYVNAPSLAEGYLNNPKETQKKFITYNGVKFYRTGDLAVFLDDGQLQVQGRSDFIVTIKNNQIHLNKVETALLQIPQIKTCVVIPCQSDNFDIKLVAYIVPMQSSNLVINQNNNDCAQIRQHLESYLPSYAIPHEYIELASLPISHISGKIDRKSLESIYMLKHQPYASLRNSELSSAISKRLNAFEQSIRQASEHYAGYPDNLNYDYTPLLPFFQYSMINAGDPFVQTDWALHSKDFERESVEWFAQLYQLDPAWGYITSGGTEGNFHGIFLGRERYPDGILYFSSESHYSIAKAAYMMKIPHVIIPSQCNGEIEYNALRHALAQYSRKPAIINLNIGTTMDGAIDDIDQVCGLLTEHPGDFYLHCDAALGGMLLPFLDNAPRINFKDYPINSLAVSGNKFIGAPIPHGVVLSRASDVEKVGAQVDYIGCQDKTITGVRSGLAALCLWYAIQTRQHHFATEAQHCVVRAQYLQQQLQKIGVLAQLNPFSNTVVFPKPIKQICQKWQLATKDGRAHIVVMQHLDYSKIDNFIDDMRFRHTNE